MRIREIAITVGKLHAAASFYRDVLMMPVAEEADRATVRVGFSRLVMTPGKEFDGVHHVAFGVSPHDFDDARSWLTQRVDLIIAGDSDVIEGPPGWNSRSMYFLGPEDILLEFIGRQADAALPPRDRDVPTPFSISEIGVAVPNTKAAVTDLTRELGLPTFPPQEADFAPVGDHDGLLIVVDQDRAWFPSRVHHAAVGPLTVRIDAPHQPGRVTLTKNVSVVAANAE
ncbi:VOC family protein [Kribbella sp. VKM Ac-2566]|uniref:VOC family protein n=1 Tax=Kribbella sp. VKM Ac-2566 TaxID=2512218 RepID=UPI0010624AD5|nr:hypothetical protein [Kribbella sp. VKM Ac-2566]TDX08260.1 catechol-2,3-dioxygenase [Kribbella sp. VKM Ac-2566]